MPWINKDMCTGCGICIEECPVDAIEQQADGLAEIDEAKCIRCGRCHEVCPQDAVRHDGERIPQQVAANLQWVAHLLDHFEDPKQRDAFLERIVRLFSSHKKVAEQTIEVIKTAGDNPAETIETAIESLTGLQKPQGN